VPPGSPRGSSLIDTRKQTGYPLSSCLVFFFFFWFVFFLFLWHRINHQTEHIGNRLTQGMRPLRRHLLGGFPFFWSPSLHSFPPRELFHPHLHFINAPWQGEKRCRRGLSKLACADFLLHPIAVRPVLPSLPTSLFVLPFYKRNCVGKQR